MVSLTDIVTYLSAIASIAVIFGVAFVVIQLRQNALLLEANLRQQRSDVAISLVEQISHPTFPLRRSRMYNVVRHFQATDWKDAFDSTEDLEARNYAYIFELIGVMARHDLVDVQLLTDILQVGVVRDWQIFEPHARYLADNSRLGFDPFTHFKWLAGSVQKGLQSRPRGAAPPPQGPPV